MSNEKYLKQKVIIRSANGWRDDQQNPVPEDQVEKYLIGQYLPDGTFENREDVRHQIIEE